MSSADWMPRNFFRRVEIAVPSLSGVLRERLIAEVLGVCLADNVQARLLGPDGEYASNALAAGQKPVRSQVEFVRLATRPPTTRAGSRSKTRYPRMTLASRPKPLGGSKRQQ
jgi:polyphosphate kinase